MDIAAPPFINREGINWVSLTAFTVCHAGAVTALFYFSWSAFFTALGLYWLSLSLGIGMGYHRLLMGTTWQNGWIVFSDYGANGTVSGNDLILRVQTALTGTDTITPDNNSVTYVTFNREGFATGLPTGNTGVNFVVRTTNPATSQFLRCLNLVFVGSLSTLHAGQANSSGGTCPTS